MTASARRRTDTPDADAMSAPSKDPRMVGVEEHAWTAELRDALVEDGTDDTACTIAGAFPDADEQLLDVGDRRLERMDADDFLAVAAVQEFERCLTQLWMARAMLFPRTGERYLDHDTFRAILEVAATHEVPSYIHPQFPPQAPRAAESRRSLSSRAASRISAS